MFNSLFPQSKSPRKPDAKGQKQKISRYLSLGLAALSLVFSYLLFLFPFCTVEDLNETIIPLGVLSFGSGSIALLKLVLFLTLGVACTLSLGYLLISLRLLSRKDASFVEACRRSIWVNVGITGAYFAGGIIYSTLINMRGVIFVRAGGSFFPFFLTACIAIVFAVILRNFGEAPPDYHKRMAKSARIEFFLYATLISILTAIAALTDIIQIQILQPSDLDPVKINGWKLLTSYTKQEAGFQLLTFFLVAILTVTVTLFLLSLTSLISRSKMFYRVTLAGVISGGISSLLIGLFGKYYQIAQKINESILFSWVNDLLNVDVGQNFSMEYKIKSPAFLWFVGVALVILLVLIRKPYTKGTMNEALISVNGISGGDFGNESSLGDLPGEPVAGKLDRDPCPAFTELDRKFNDYQNELDELRASAFQNPTLPGLVQFVVTYARDSRLHLSYTPQDIAAFVAGLGATRLTILQGMSGTGKTSLPKIFTEAVLGNCEIIEVESSWRDKNELLGYYNEFSRTYTPKKFTQALYKARLCPERLTFIVLDEMNLSRIEYYFSDFLSLMENEENKREIKLLNHVLFRYGEGKRTAYYGLIEGNTVKIPPNVWFIGTANRDESTFEISDKVYDRAHTMNFNRRAPKVTSVHEPIPQRYLTAEELIGLLREAVQTVHFDLDSCAVIREVEELLAPYNISFGNRIANQMEAFVRIYAACFAPSETIIREALETILLSKVVSKLEMKSVDDKEELAAEFDRLGLARCAEFIRKLNED